MATTQDATQTLTKELQQDDSDIEKAQKALAETQDELARLTAAQSQLKKLVDDLETASADTAKAREAIAKPRAEAKQRHTDLLALLEGVTPAQHEAVTDAVKSVDDAIAKLRTQQDTARETLATATADAEASRAKGSSKDADLAKAQAALKALPGQIQAMQADATKAAAAAALAREAKQTARAVLLLDQLAEALASIDTITDPAYEDGLKAKIANAWEDHAAASNAQSDAATAVANAQAGLDETTKLLDAAMKSRDQDLKSKLVALETAWAKQPAEPAAAEKAGGTSAAEYAASPA
jgi:chromosome segregation ATPase